MIRNHKTSPSGKRLAFETLENRELLSLNPVLPSADFNQVETRDAAIYAAIESDPTIRFTLDDNVDVSNVIADPVVLKQPVVNYYKACPTSIDLGWGAIDGARSYEVFYRKSTVKTFTSCGVTDANSMTINDLKPGSTYCVMIVSKGDGVMTLDSKTQWSSDIKTTQYQKLATPKITSVTSTTRSISVSWTETPSVSNYEVAYRKSTEKTFSVWQNIEGGASSVVIDSLEPGVSYVVKVTAKGDGRSTLDSSGATKTIKTVAIPRLAQPTITSATSDLREIELSWKETPNATGYKIVYRKTTEKVFSTANVEAGATQYTLSRLEPNSSYQIKVVAIGDGETTLDSVDTKSKTVKTKAIPRLAQPTITSVTSDLREIELSWKETPNATGYKIVYRKTTEKVFSTTNVEAGATQYTLSRLEPNSSYQIKVVALGDGETTLDSVDTKSKTVKTKALAKLAAPTISDYDSDKHSVYVRWNSVDGATGYKVEWRASKEKTWHTEKTRATENFCALEYLDPNASYLVRVTALGDQYETLDSSASKTKTVKTQALDLLPQPTIVGSFAASHRSVYVRWYFIEDAKGYAVTYRSSNSKTPTTVYVDVSETNCRIECEPGTKLTITVTALGDNYETKDSVPSKLVTITTPPLERLDTPVVLSTKTSDTAITVYWSVVSEAYDYVVTYRRVGTKDTITVPDKAFRGLDYASQTITQLDPGAQYVVSIVATSDPNYYLESSPLTVKVATSKAPKALAPKFTRIYSSDRALEVELDWTPIENARGYEVVFGLVGGTESDKRYAYKSASETSVAFKVPKKAQYYCKVRAFGIEDYLDSDFSEICTFWV